MAQDPLFDLLFELFFFSCFFLCFVATELLQQHEEDHQYVPFTYSEFPQPSKLLKFIQPSFITAQHNNNSSSFSSSSSSSCPSSSSYASASSSSSSNPENKHVKSSIKSEDPLQVICEICAETKWITQMIRNKTCDHSYCSDCMTKHVVTKIQDSITAVPCPGLDCESVFELEACRPWLPRDIIERWDQALCEALFLKVPKFYCPFKDCSAMMLVENEEDQGAEETECLACHRMFCARCNVSWHPGVDCEEYQKLNENERQREDLLVRQLAKEKKWRRCPKCRFYVEKLIGCLHITCRCKYQFCYACGEEWNSTHGGCQRN
ncbi:hypothetical protein QN277_022688 [Acacia crassicarpa]|uniref:RBR-type E3 ubiquitin transferase n=1 Tax=Acacia crassicarpa TaxID=499986 RepID=A0AAE1ML85_9FABA|nr:hypothetical protein QN277_022688 [Acacia crassicarpa]